MNNMDYKNIKTHLHEMGNDNLSVLNKTEGEFFNMFFSNRLNGLDLRGCVKIGIPLLFVKKCSKAELSQARPLSCRKDFVPLRYQN